MSKSIVLAAALALTCAWANPFPSDATLFVTDGRGTIVGVGQLVDGETFDLELAAGFGGAIKLTFLAFDGRIVVLDAMVEDGRVLLDLVDLTTVAGEAGFRRVRVAPPGELAGVEEANPPAGAGVQDADDAALGRADDRTDERADADDDAGERRGPPSEPPGRAGDPPSGPPDQAPKGPPKDAPSGPSDDAPKGPPDGAPAGPPAELPVEPPEPHAEPDDAAQP